ncbi:hypothetical protein [Kitasatospora sp. NPDC057223]|uniref:hypothetical protein n=1 Tax=Kitasatospora sp. NPDC057223 TaxID=3346055 RepID=UPI00363CD6CB
MKSVSEFAGLLGEPVRQDEGHLIEEIGRLWSVVLPEDFVAVAGAYGDVGIADRMSLLGARSLRWYADLMGGQLEQSAPVPHLVLPSEGGALLWGNTIDGDQLFLVPHEDGSWTVSAFLRHSVDHWYDSDLSFSDWFHLALAGEIATDWLPEWTSLPHVLELNE